MKCRLEHIGGRDSVSLVIGGYQLAPGFITKPMDLSVAEEEVVKEWEEEGLIKIIPLESINTNVAVEGDVAPKRMTAEEVRENMNRKKRRKSSLTQKEMNKAHGVVRSGPSLGRPFGTKNARVLTAADLKHGVPKVPAQVELVEQEIEVSEDKKKTLSADDIKAGLHKKDKTEKITEDDLGDLGANAQPFETGAVVMDETAVKAMNKATKEHAEPESPVAEEPIDEALDATEEIIVEEPSEDNVEEQGEDLNDEEDPEDDILGRIARELDVMTKPVITKIAKKLGVKFVQSTIKPDLVVLTAKKIVEKGHTKIPSDLV